ncbi:MAG: hypothetical protein HYX69_16385 [Planctomycetia bacterium]|nr:hypothetical protein [Planctomycetia bacterium]
MSRFWHRVSSRWVICGTLAAFLGLALAEDAKALHRMRRAALAADANYPPVDPGGTMAYAGGGYGANPVGFGFGGYNYGGYPLYGYAAYLPAAYAGFNDYGYAPVGLGLPGGYGCFSGPADLPYGIGCFGPRPCGWRLRARWACGAGCLAACEPAACAPACPPPCVRPCAYRRYMRRLCRAMACCGWTCLPAAPACCLGTTADAWDGDVAVDGAYESDVTDEPASPRTFEEPAEPVGPSIEEPPSPTLERAF